MLDKSKKTSKIDPEQLKMGMKVEREHSDVVPKGVDPEAFYRKIALAHLKELPDYYTRLAKMEKEKTVKVEGVTILNDPDEEDNVAEKPAEEPYMDYPEYNYDRDLQIVPVPHEQPRKRYRKKEIDPMVNENLKKTMRKAIAKVLKEYRVKAPDGPPPPVQLDPEDVNDSDMDGLDLEKEKNQNTIEQFKNVADELIETDYLHPKSGKSFPIYIDVDPRKKYRDFNVLVILPNGFPAKAQGTYGKMFSFQAEGLDESTVEEINDSVNAEVRRYL